MAGDADRARRRSVDEDCGRPKRTNGDSGEGELKCKTN
jgi:hypothetical protein